MAWRCSTIGSRSYPELSGARSVRHPTHEPTFEGDRFLEQPRGAALRIGSHEDHNQGPCIFRGRASRRFKCGMFLGRAGFRGHATKDGHTGRRARSCGFGRRNVHGGRLWGRLDVQGGPSCGRLDVHERRFCWGRGVDGRLQDRRSCMCGVRGRGVPEDRDLQFLVHRRVFRRRGSLRETARDRRRLRGIFGTARYQQDGCCALGVHRGQAAEYLRRVAGQRPRCACGLRCNAWFASERYRVRDR